MLDLPPGKAKGLIKGLRYISQMFDGEKEREMVIGNPTDVKHVAHIGHDGPTPANPSWMNDFHSAPLSSSFGLHGKELGSPKSASQEIPLGGGGDMASPKTRRTRRHMSEESATSDSSARDRSRGSRHSRRNKSSDSESSNRGGSETRRNRRHKKKQSDSDAGTQLESESSVTDLPNVPKQSRRKERKSRLRDGGPASSSSGQNNPSLAAPVPA